MKGKVTKDIIMKVGQGLVRIPREKVMDSPYGQRQNPPAETTASDGKKKAPAKKANRS